MKIIERIELLEFQMESVRSDVRIVRLECDEQKERLDRHLTGTRQFWDKTNKELVSYHRNKLHEAIEKLATSSEGSKYYTTLLKVLYPCTFNFSKFSIIFHITKPNHEMTPYIVPY